MKYPQLMSRVFREPWVITPGKHEAIQRVLLAHVAGHPAKMEMDSESEDGDEESEVEDYGQTRVIPVYGILGKHLSGMEMMCGGCSIDDICSQIDLAKYDSNVARVLFDFRSPGGTVTGIPELAEEIAELGKPTFAFTDSECCSGAMWLAAQCDEFYATGSSQIGSVGVYRYFEDHSEEMKKAGVKPEPISAGEFKLMGAYFKPLSDAERELAQAGVNQIFEDFKTAVNIKRPIADEFLQGQVFRGIEAVQNGFLSGLVGGFEDCIELINQSPV